MNRLVVASAGLLAAITVGYLLFSSASEAVPGTGATPAEGTVAEAEPRIDPLGLDESRSALAPVAVERPVPGNVAEVAVSMQLDEKAPAGFTGKVTLRDGTAGAYATIVDALDHRSVATADGDGRFELPAMTPTGFVFASLPGHARSRVAAVEPEEVIELVLRGPGAGLEVRVLSEEGEPVELAEIEITQPFAAHFEGTQSLASSRKPAHSSVYPELRGSSDRRGLAKFTELPSAPHRIEVRAPGLVSQAVVTPPLEPGEVAPFELVLLTHASVIGRVTMPTGEEVAGNDRGVSISSSSGLPDQVWTMVAEDGTYRLDGLRPGLVELEARGPGLETVQDSMEVTVGEPARWDPVLTPSLRIEGRLLDAAGAPLAGWVLASHRQSLMTSMASCSTDANGRFVLEGVAAETSALSARPRQNDYDPEQGFAVFRGVRAGDTGLVLTVSEASLISRMMVHGRVTYPDGSVPEFAWVGLSSPATGSSMRTKVDAQGEFRFGWDQFGGDFVLQATAGTERWLRPVSSTLTLTDGEERDLGVIEVPRPGWVDVTLLVPDEPRRGSGRLTLAAMQKHGESEAYEEVPWDSEMPMALSPGRYRLGLNATHYAASTIDFTVQSERTTQVTLPARPSTTVELSIVGPGGLPPEGDVRLEIRHAATDMLLREVTAAATGRIVLDLEPMEGGYRIMAYAENGSTGSIAGQLTGQLTGQDQPQVIHLEGP